MPQSRSMPKSLIRLLLAFLLLLGLVGLGTTVEITATSSYRPVPPPLPQTGSDAQLAMLLGGAALVLLGGLVVLLVRRRRG